MIVLALVVLALADVAAAASPTQPGAAAPPAQVINPRPEADLTKVVLSPEAEARLGIRVGAIEQRPLRRTRVLGGEVVVPAWATAGPNAQALVLQSPPDRVQAAQALVAADADVEAAKVEVGAATIELARAQKVLAGGAGSARAVDEARAKLALARTRLAAAERRREVIAKASFGTPERLWVRVPIYAGDVNRLAADASVQVGKLGDQVDQTRWTAKPVAGPSSANAAAATVDLFFELDDADGRLRPGEKVDVALALRDEEPASVVPWSAVLHDVHGGEWVYEQSAPHSFTRRRVQVHYVTDGFAALANGPAPGTPVVIEGAAELFSTEFGVGI